MAKLVIEYRTKDEENYLKGQTYFIYTFDSRTTTISIAPDETRKLREIVKGIEKELQDGFYLKENETLEIDDTDKSIMEYEEEKNRRIEGKLYPILKLIYKNKDNPEQIERFLKILCESGCSECK